MASSRKLELILHSANDLQDVKVFGTMDPYATIWIAEGGIVSKTHKTDVAKKAGSFPVWNHRMVFNVNYPLKTNCILFCEINHDGKLLDRKIGEVQVPLTEFLAGDGSSKKVSYPVKTESGEVKGDIVVSYKFLEPGVKKEGSTGHPKGGINDRKPKKKKDGFMKQMAKNVAVNVASKVVMVAGLAGIAYIGTSDLLAEEENRNTENPEDHTVDGNQVGDQAVDGNQVEDHAVVDEDEDVDVDEDVDQDDDGYDDDYDVEF